MTDSRTQIVGYRRRTYTYILANWYCVGTQLLLSYKYNRRRIE